MPQQFNKLIQIIDDAINKFQERIPDVQMRLYEQLSDELDALKTSGGRILSTTENLKLIISIKNKLEKLLLNNDYVSQVKNLLTAFDAISDFHNNYFSQFNAKFKPGQTLALIKQMSIEATVNSLTEAGIGANIIEPINNILRVNTTTGGSKAKMNEILRNNIISNDTGDGSLLRYSKQITTDALNQFSAQYNKQVASDLGLEWFMYVGSNLTTTRPWCEAMTGLKYIHISELPEAIKGVVNGEKIPLSSKTNLPAGMIPGTNAQNVMVYRGGYNCGHQLVAVDELAVPQERKTAVYASFAYKNWKARMAA